MKNQIDVFKRCFSAQGTDVVCEHENGTYVVGEKDERAPTIKKSPGTQKVIQTI